LLLTLFFLPSSVIAQEVKYVGMCNASAAVALDANHFTVADDEDNMLRIYDRNVTARPFQTVALSKIFAVEIQDGEDLEIDLEGAAVLGGKIFWIGSIAPAKKASSGQHVIVCLPCKSSQLPMENLLPHELAKFIPPWWQILRRIADSINIRFTKQRPLNRKIWVV
jgi:hypothetical protein